MKRIYLDHAAATPIDPQVQEVMFSWMKEFGNPSSLHEEGKKTKEAMEDARSIIAQSLSAQAEEIIFTASGTESCNLAILGAAEANQEKGKHIITTAVEHHAVLASCKALEKKGFEVMYLPVDEYGAVTPSQVAEAIREDTILVSVIFANNEVGTINPIKEITRAVKKKNPQTLVHTDACQAFGTIPLHVKSLNIDFLTINAAKIYGPKGVGVLYKKKEAPLMPLIHGGGQEKGYISGTQNVPAIMGFAKAVEQLEESDAEKTKEVRDYFLKKIQSTFPEARLNGHPTERLVNNVNISLPGYEGEVLVIYLDEKGIACSTGAACTTAKTEPSHVLLAMGKSEEEAKSSLRFTIGKSTTKEDIDTSIMALKETLEILSPHLKSKSPNTN